MGCTDSKPVAKPSSKANKANKAKEKAVKVQTPSEQEAQEAQALPPREEGAPAEAAEVCAEVAGTVAATAAEMAEPVMDMELEAELPVIPEVHPGIKAEPLEDSETTAEPKDEESPRLFGRLKVEAAPELSQGPCLCTNLW